MPWQDWWRLTRTQSGSPGGAFTSVSTEQISPAGQHAAGDINVDLSGPYLEVATAAGQPGTWADLIPRPGVVSVQRLSYTQGTDVGSNFSVSIGNNVLVGAQSFTLGKANSVVLLSARVGVSISGNPSAVQCALLLQVDSAGGYQFGGVVAPANASPGVSLAGSVLMPINNLGSGSHTLRVLLYANAAEASGFYLRPSSFPNIEFYALQVVEIMA